MRANRPHPSERHLLAPGLAVSPYCLGVTDDEETIPAAYDAGINFFFLPWDMHFPVYETARRGLVRLLARGGDIRSKIVVAAVGYVENPLFFRHAARELLYAVPELERLDVIVAGGCQLADLDARLDVLPHVRREQQARAIGASFHSRPAALAATLGRRVDIAFVRFNAAHPGARTDLFPRLPSGGPLVYNFLNTGGYVAPTRLDALGLDEGYWRPRVVDHYRFVLSQPRVDGMLCALRRPAHIDALLRAIDDGPLDAEEVDYLIELVQLDRGRIKLLGDGDASTAE